MKRGVGTQGISTAQMKCRAIEFKWWESRRFFNF
jgi:hypothetical protein